MGRRRAIAVTATTTAANAIARTIGGNCLTVADGHYEGDGPLDNNVAPISDSKNDLSGYAAPVFAVKPTNGPCGCAESLYAFESIWARLAEHAHLIAIDLPDSAVPISLTS